MLNRRILNAAVLAVLAAGTTLADDSKKAPPAPDPAEQERALQRALKKSDPETKAKRLLELAGTAEVTIAGRAREAFQAIPAGHRLEPLKDLLRKGRPSPVRALAAEELGLLGEKKTSSDLFAALCKDRTDIVRSASLTALEKILPKEELLRGLTSRLSSEDACARMRAEEALGKAADRDDRIGEDFVVEVLVTILHSTYGGGSRNHVLFANQMAYIADYDVEIAADAAIADPIVATVTDGVVLDTKVVKVEETRIIYERRVVSRALAGVTGDPNPDDPKAWLSWWEKNRGEFLFAKK